MSRRDRLNLKELQGLMQGTVLCKRRSCYSDGCWGVTRMGRVVWPQKYWVHPLVSGLVLGKTTAPGRVAGKGWFWVEGRSHPSLAMCRAAQPETTATAAK